MKSKVKFFVSLQCVSEKNSFPEDLKSKGRKKMMKFNVFKTNCDVIGFSLSAGLQYKAYMNTHTHTHTC